MTERYNLLPETQLDPIMLANQRWADMKKEHEDPINTTVGILLDQETGAPWRPESVETWLKATQNYVERKQDYAYQKQSGNHEFVTGMMYGVFGNHIVGTQFKEIIAHQALGGTGALTLAKEALSELVAPDPETGRIHMVLDDGWPNHHSIFGSTFDIHTYKRGMPEQNQHSLLELIDEAPAQSVVLLQACGYNDDGLDRDLQEQDELIDAIVDKQLPVIIDSAYLGIVDGPDADNSLIRKAVHAGLLTFVTASASKNMGLYNERVGALYVANAGQVLGHDQAKLLAQVTDRAVRRLYSNPPLVAAMAVSKMFRDNESMKAYQSDLAKARYRLYDVRAGLTHRVGDRFPQVGIGRGMFTKLLPETGFTQAQVKQFEQVGVLVLPNSRINIGGIALRHVDRLGEVIKTVTNS